MELHRWLSFPREQVGALLFSARLCSKTAVLVRAEVKEEIDRPELGWDKTPFLSFDLDIPAHLFAYKG